MDDFTSVINTSSNNKSLNRTASRPDTLNSEFLYYSSVLKIVAPALSESVERKKILPWVRKLFRPEYHSSQFREKRNKYLLFLTITLLADEAFNIFDGPPPELALPEFEDIPPIVLESAQWELDKSWMETLNNLPNEFKPLECPVHKNPNDCTKDHKYDKIMDQEFQYLLYLAKPYAALLKGRNESTRAASWLQTLCTIAGESCSSMRGIRNDYMMALIGYLQDLRLAGPFSEYPSIRTLEPLALAARTADKNRPVTDPNNADAADFMAIQPIPQEGAFCYIALTGELLESSFTDPKISQLVGVAYGILSQLGFPKILNATMWLLEVYNDYTEYLDKHGDYRVKNYFFMKSPILLCGIVLTWFLFVVKWGPAFMKNRQPFKIDGVLVVYNAIQVVVCLIIAIISGRHVFTLSPLCSPLTFDENMTMMNCAYAYFIVKIVDLLDTIFFVLRKKYNQITVLHVFHHALMVFGSWSVIMFYGSGHSAFVPFINTIVHTIMYMYYLLSAYSEQYKKSVWWKKYITQLQLFQFGLLFLLYGPMLFQPSCTFPKGLAFFITVQNFIVTVLFSNFYYQTYIKKKSPIKLK